MTDTAGSRLLGTPGGPMNTPGGGGAGGPGAGGGVGRTGWGRGRGVVGPTGRGVVGAGHLSQYHRFLQRRLHSCTGSGLQVVVGVLPQEVRYVFHSHFRTFFQQLLLLGGEAKANVAPALEPESAKGMSEGWSGKSWELKITSMLFLSSQYGRRGLRLPRRFPLHSFCQTFLHS